MHRSGDAAAPRRVGDQAGRADRIRRTRGGVGMEATVTVRGIVAGRPRHVVTAEGTVVL